MYTSSMKKSLLDFSHYLLDVLDIALGVLDIALGVLDVYIGSLHYSYIKQIFNSLGLNL